MVEGLLRHCTNAEIGANYVDTGDATVVGFDFTELLAFRLLPRLKNIGSIRLYCPDDAGVYGELGPAPGHRGVRVQAAYPQQLREPLCCRDYFVGTSTKR